MDPALVSALVAAASGFVFGLVARRRWILVAVPGIWMCVWIALVASGAASPGDSGKTGSLLWGIVFVVVPSALGASAATLVALKTLHRRSTD